MLWFSLVCALSASVLSAGITKNLSITIQSDGSLEIDSSLDSTADVEAIYIDSMNETGWDILEIKINVIKHSYSVTDNQRAFAAGVAEGYLTSLPIYQTYQNIINTSFWDFTDGPEPNLVEFLDEQSTYMNEQISQNQNDSFWQYAALLQQQLSGLQYGYNLTAPNYDIPTYNDSWPFQFLNLAGDLLDLMSALSLDINIYILSLHIYNTYTIYIYIYIYHTKQIHQKDWIIMITVQRNI